MDRRYKRVSGKEMAPVLSFTRTTRDRRVDEERRNEGQEERQKSPCVSGGILLPGQRIPMKLWEIPERENSWSCSDFLFQTYPFGLQRWEGKKHLRPHS